MNTKEITVITVINKTKMGKNKEKRAKSYLMFSAWGKTIRCEHLLWGERGDTLYLRENNTAH